MASEAHWLILPVSVALEHSPVEVSAFEDTFVFSYFRIFVFSCFRVFVIQEAVHR